MDQSGSTPKVDAYKYVERSNYDVLEKGLALVFCGINPSIRAAKTGHNFGSASNRFWRGLHLSGFTSSQPMARNDRNLLEFGCGITAAVARATRNAAELSKAELKMVDQVLHRKIEYF